MDRGWRIFFFSAALFNYVIGIPIALFPAWTYKITYVDGTPSDPMTLRLWASFGLGVLMIGYGYQIVARNLGVNRGVVVLGILAKLFDVINLTTLWLGGQGHAIVLLPAAIDASYTVGFMIFLATYSSARSLPRTGFRDLLSLIRFLRQNKGNSGRALVRWNEELERRHGTGDLILNLFVKKVVLVRTAVLSKFILSGEPRADGFLEGDMKKKGMSFLAPQALTITHGDQWRRLRQFNEAVLMTPLGDGVDQVIEKEFHSPVRTAAEVRAGLERVMRWVVFGDRAVDAGIAEDVQTLFGHVQSPVKRVLFGLFQGGRRRRLYAALDQACSVGDPSGNALIDRAIRNRDATSGKELTSQIPHWMFTFTGSLTDLVVRTTAMINARPAIRERALVEGEGVFLDGCIYETARLFPPVTKALHRSPNGAIVGDFQVPDDLEIVHLFLLQNRYPEGDARLQAFRPEDWEADWQGMHDRFPNTFLSGARVCPGRNIAMTVARKTILAILRNGSDLRSPALANEPLPFDFPKEAIFA